MLGSPLLLSRRLLSHRIYHVWDSFRFPVTPPFPSMRCVQAESLSSLLRVSRGVSFLQIVGGCLPGKQQRGVYGLPADIWAAGVLAAELVAGGPPFESDSKEATYQRILDDEPWLPPHLSPSARSFIAEV